MIEQKYIDMILDRIEIEDVVSNYIPSMQRKGRRLWTCCPFHNEKTPSFCVEPDKGKWYCFGCHEGGNVITFVMKMDGLPFPKAVKKLLHDYLHVNLEDAEMHLTPEEETREKLRETMFIYNELLCKWFREQMNADNENAKAAKAYAEGRWTEQFCEDTGIGFAPDSWNALVDWARNKGLDLDIFNQLGVILKSEKTGNPYSFFRNRVMIPIRDRYSRIVGFTGRTMADNEERKYLNSSKSLIYNKEYSVYGIDIAARQARILEKINLVEGASDAGKIQSLGILNVVASLGGAWTKGQLEQLQRLKCSLRIIPDNDVIREGETLGAGFKNAIANGILAIRMGFSVSVSEIPGNGVEKQDPGSFITSKAIFNHLPEEEFILWYARVTWNEEFLAEEKVQFIANLCDLLVYIKDEDLQQTYLNSLVAKYHDRSAWLAGLRTAKRRKQETISKKRSQDDIEMLREFGFTVNNNCYFGTTKEGTQVKWSNCVLRPCVHVKDDLRPVRIFYIQNNESGSQPELIELDMDTLTSAKSLRKKLLGMGNYMWFGDENALIQLQSYLAKATETAIEIKQLGWQQQGFWCFCNGVQEDGVWIPVDDMGIVRLKSGNYYLPAMSKLYERSSEFYTNERRFIHLGYSKITLYDYFTKIVNVFGDNAIIAICFLLATLFRDIVKEKARFFPMLNIFGPKGSGKTQLAETLMTLFAAQNDPPNIETATMAALSEAVASVCNALVHIDEYKNSVDIKKLEWLKDLWGGIGRTKMNMDKDKKREQARVDSGIVITGQEMPTADIALFTRLIYLTYDKQHHTVEERNRFEDLMHFRVLGATHITLEILRHRDSFQASFNDAWKEAGKDLHERLGGEEILDRIEHNWLVPLAAYLAIRDKIELPFTYEQVLELCVAGIKRQNALCNSTDEVASFWNIISSAQQKGLFKEGEGYMIKTVTSLHTNQCKEPIVFDEPRQILMIRKNSMMTTYRQLGRQMDEKLLPSESMLHYLMNSAAYLGITISPKRFKKFGQNGMPLQHYETDDKGNVVSTRTVYDRDRPLCFDYPMISEKFGIILDSETVAMDEDDDAPF